MADPQAQAIPADDPDFIPADDNQKQPTQPTAQPSAASRFGTNLAQGAGVVSNEQGRNFFLHPIDTAKSILSAQGELGARAAKELKSGDYVGALTHGTEYLLPGVGPTLARSGDQLEHEDYAGGIGTMIGAALPIVAGKAIPTPAGVPEAEPGIMARPGNPRVIPVTSSETAARAITRAVNPAVNEWPNYIKATAQEAGNIKDFAARNNLPLKTQLDWVNAARGAAEESRGYFNEKVLGPHANESVPTTGVGFKGPNAGEGQNATIGEINGRIGKINDELRSAYQKREAGQTREALANEPDLVAERNALTDILHKELAKRTGMTPEQVATLRHRFGSMYSVADQTEAAVNQRQSSAGKAIEGRRDVPTSTAGVGVGLYNQWVRGGPEGIANRSFVRALGRSRAIPVTELPEVHPAAPAQITASPVVPRGELPLAKPIPVEQISPEELQQQRVNFRRPIWKDSAED